MEKNDGAPHNESKRATLRRFYRRRLQANESLLRQLYERLLGPFLKMSQVHAEASSAFDSHRRRIKSLGEMAGAISETYWQTVGAYRRNQRIVQLTMADAASGITIAFRKMRLWEKRLARIENGLGMQDFQSIPVQRREIHEYVWRLIRMDNLDWEMIGDLALQRNFLRDPDEGDGGQPASGSGSIPTVNPKPTSGQSTALIRFRKITRTK